MNTLRKLATLVGLALAGVIAHAQSAPMMVHYQGRLTQPNGLPLTTPTASVAFEIFPSASGGTRLWPPAGPLSTYTVILRNGGIFSVMLGDTSIPGMPALTQSVFQQGVVYLQISIAGNPVGPRQPIVSVPWSILSQQANLAVNVVDGAITTAKLANDAVTTAKIASNSVTTAKIADGTIGENDIANGALTGPKIVDGAVTPLKLALDAAGLPRVTGGVAIMEGQSISLGGSGYTAGVRFVSHGRVRIVGDVGTNSAGVLLNTGTTDIGFIGTVDASALGFYGGAGAGWGLIMKADTGRVGVGTTQPSAQLHVTKIGTNATPALRLTSRSNASSKPLLMIDELNESGTGGTEFGVIGSGDGIVIGNSWGSLFLGGNSNGSFNARTLSVLNSGQVAVNNPTPNFAETFLVNGSARVNSGLTVWGGGFERFRVDVNGAVTAFGNMHVGGTITAGNKAFLIDHPLDPANKTLRHSCIEGPEALNIYRGRVRSDGRGYAEVKLPDYFTALNGDPQFLLTIVDERDSDSFAMAKVVSGIQENRFRIRTSVPNTVVHWQVTGVRRDPSAVRNRQPVEAWKDPASRGTYLDPEAHRKRP